MDQIVVRNAEAAASARALHTLGEIRHYVETNRFSLSSLTRGLMRTGTAAALQCELGWLVAAGYMTKGTSSIYELTAKGIRYVPPESDEPEEQFTLEFSPTVPEPEPEERPDPRRRRR